VSNPAPKFFKKEPGEYVVGVGMFALTAMQSDGCCDSCNKALPKETRVLGKSVKLEKGNLLGARFSPTCLQCAGLS
jgi:hypothetical protein